LGVWDCDSDAQEVPDVDIFNDCSVHDVDANPEQQANKAGEEWADDMDSEYGYSFWKSDGRGWFSRDSYSDSDDSDAENSSVSWTRQRSGLQSPKPGGHDQGGWSRAERDGLRLVRRGLGQFH
jgi:hypothetical protein